MSGGSSDDDDVPEADPKIRIEYEAALGRFILAFNEVDYFMSALLSQEFDGRKVPHLARGLWARTFAGRLDQLEGLATTARLTQVQKLPFAQMRDLNGHRNRLAHGHFDQNPFDGSYELLAKQKAHDYPISRVDSMAAELGEIADAIRGAYYAGEFPTRPDKT